jgi:peptide/nickel transport system substrate-binding protein
VAFLQKAGQFIYRLEKKIGEKLVGAYRKNNERGERSQVFALKNKKFPGPAQFKYIKEVLTKKEKIFLQIFFVIFVLSSLFIGTLWYVDHTEKIPVAGGEYTEGLIGVPQMINPTLPSLNDVDGDFVRLIYSALLRKNVKQEYVGDLASGFDISADQKIYVVHLRDNIFWHDGEEFGVSDVLFTIEMVQNPAVKSPLCDLWRNVRVEKIDEKTIQFVLNEPSASFLNMLTLGIIPEHLWRDIPLSGFALADLNTRPIGTGPYVFVSLSRDRRGNIKSYTLSANQSYYLGQPNINKLVFKFFPNRQSAYVALDNQGIDGMAFIDRNLKLKIMRHDLNFYDQSLSQYSALFFNTKRELFKDKGVRLALAAAIDRKILAYEILSDVVLPADGIFSNTPFASSRGISGADTAMAGGALDALDWKLGADGLRHKITITKVSKKVGRKTVTEENVKDEILAITITTTDQKENVAAANFIKESWQKIGIKTEVKIFGDAELRRNILKARDFDVLIYGEILGQDLDPFSFWHSSQMGEAGFNLSSFASRELDQLLEQARKASSAEARAQKYHAIDELLVKEMPAIFLWTPSYYYGIDKSIKGVQFTVITDPSNRFSEIKDWYIKTKRVWK